MPTSNAYLAKRGASGHTAAADGRLALRDGRSTFIDEAAILAVTHPVLGLDRGENDCRKRCDICLIRHRLPRPRLCAGTGTPEIGGFTTREAQTMLRSLDGVAIAGADVVEVAPPFDVGGITALAGATMMFELLCLVAARISPR